MQQQTPPFHLKARATETMCATCPPDRVCAWGCVQGMNHADIVIGAALEQSSGWARTHHDDPGTLATQHALWELYNG